VRWEILLLEPVNDWFIALCAEQVAELAIWGPQLGRPLVDRIHGSKIHNLKELRPRVGGASEVRLLFVFDAAREAIILVAGDKAGRWSGWYAEAIPLAEGRYGVYQQENGEKEQ
jgi:hypothetical protein